MSRILVTGGAGYVGSHVCKALHAHGHEPVAIDNLSEGHDWAVKWGPLVRGDIADGEFVRRTIREHDIEGVIHMASLAYVGESVKDPGKYWFNNVGNAARLFDALAAEGVRDVVFSSSCAIYGVPERLPITEDLPPRPINPYGHTKLVIEAMLADFAAAHGLRSVSLRYFNAAGADPDGEIGEDHDPEPHLIPNILAAAAGYRPAIDILGDDYNTPDGTCVRDFVHVTDLAAAHVAALAYLREGGASRSFNLGTGEGRSVRQVIDAVERVTGRPVPQRVGPRRPGDPPALVADPGMAREVLGFATPHSDLDTLVATAWRWYQAHFAARADSRRAAQ
ncbi:UDP-glucose 4-epimerase GalE [Afifella sp. IM 167]|uniref:UDP-glucose 4-epimerase GalE n=1 Tax=Afifella sp. IM 167 TaxID=2033586 RepID=UPI001CC903DF|nr:UDP-glucose 4-epimerase GalE [Afifella sp. IM 167]MBZ8134237.1 UDP-glucose 4-epimerase GalE [Afifella sp. IM 167]